MDLMLCLVQRLLCLYRLFDLLFVQDSVAFLKLELNLVALAEKEAFPQHWQLYQQLKDRSDLQQHFVYLV